MTAMFPLFQGMAPDGHPYPHAFRGNVVVRVAATATAAGTAAEAAAAAAQPSAVPPLHVSMNNNNSTASGTTPTNTSNAGMQSHLKQILGVTRAQGVPHSMSTLMFLCSSLPPSSLPSSSLIVSERQQILNDAHHNRNMSMVAYDQAKQNIPELVCDYLSARVFEAR
jgi:hypothetical protein